MGCEVVATEASIDYMRRVRVMTLAVYDLPQIAPRVQTFSLVRIVTGPVSVRTACECCEVLVS
jgi:hypothetical protein